MRKTLAISIAVITCIIVYLKKNNPENLFLFLAYYMIIPLPLILFSEEISQLTGISFW